MNDEQNDNGPEIEKKERKTGKPLSLATLSPSPVVPVVVEVRDRRRIIPSVEVVQQGGEAEGGVGGVGERATVGVAVFFAVEVVAEGGAVWLREERASGHRREGGFAYSLSSLSSSLSLSLSLDETLSDTSVFLFSSLEEKEGGQKRQRQAERSVGEEREKALTTMTPSATEKN